MSKERANPTGFYESVYKWISKSRLFPPTPKPSYLEIYPGEPINRTYPQTLDREIYGKFRHYYYLFGEGERPPEYTDQKIGNW